MLSPLLGDEDEPLCSPADDDRHLRLLFESKWLFRAFSLCVSSFRSTLVISKEGGGGFSCGWFCSFGGLTTTLISSGDELCSAGEIDLSDAGDSERQSRSHSSGVISPTEALLLLAALPEDSWR